MATTSTGSQSITGASRRQQSSSRYVWTKRINRFLLYALAIVTAVLFAAPFFWTVSSSLKPISEIYLYPPTLFPKEIRWQNYPDVFRLAPFARFIWNTIVITAFAMVGQILSAAAVAYGFTRFRFPFRDALFFIVLATMMLPWQVTIVPLFLLFRYLGWINTFLPLIVPSFFGGGAFYIFLLRQFFMTIPARP